MPVSHNIALHFETMYRLIFGIACPEYPVQFIQSNLMVKLQCSRTVNRDVNLLSLLLKKSLFLSQLLLLQLLTAKQGKLRNYAGLGSCLFSDR